jgi:hypothetical protein
MMRVRLREKTQIGEATTSEMNAVEAALSHRSIWNQQIIHLISRQTTHTALLSPCPCLPLSENNS